MVLKSSFAASVATAPLGVPFNSTRLAVAVKVLAVGVREPALRLADLRVEPVELGIGSPFPFCIRRASSQRDQAHHMCGALPTCRIAWAGASVDATPRL